MQASVRLLRFMQIFMLAAMGIFILLPKWLHPHPNHPPVRVMFFSITAMACVDVVVAFLMHRLITQRATLVLARNPEDMMALNRWRMAYVIAFTLAISIGLLGLILRFRGFNLGQVAPFYVAGIGMLLYFNPR